MRLPVFALLRLAVRVAPAAMGLSRSRAAALRGFRQGLAEMGVPPEAVKELARHYPELPWGRAVTQRRREVVRSGPRQEVFPTASAKGPGGRRPAD